MAITPDASSPALRQGFANPLTTATFSPPAGSTLVALVTDTASTTHTFTLSNSGTPLTWVLAARYNYVAVYTAFNAAAQSNITVTFATNGSSSDGLVNKVVVFNSVDSAVPVVQTSTGSSSTSFITPNLYNSDVDNSRGIYIANDSNAPGSPGPGGPDVRFDYNLPGKGVGIIAYKSANTTPVNTNVDAWLDGFGTAATNWNWIGVELRPSTTQTVTLTGIPSGEAVGTPQINQVVQPTGIASSEAFGTPAVAASNLIIVPGIPSVESFGVPALVYNQFVSPTGIASGEAFGTLNIQLGYPQTLLLQGIPSSESVGFPLVKLTSRMVFRPPSVQEQPMARNILHMRYGIHRGITVIKRTDGTFYETRYPDQVTVEESAKVYWGGHVNEISVAEAQALTTAGYGSLITTEVIT